MRLIHKRGEPRDLTTFRQREGARYDSVDLPKQAMQTALLAEQQGLCCYCMRRLTRDAMKIEHYLSQAGHEVLRLDWKNLLGACRGNETGASHHPTMTKSPRHCDASRGDAALSIDPRRPQAMQAIGYGADGAVKSGFTEHQADLDEVLNLNWDMLKGARRAALSGFMAALKRRAPHASWSREVCERELRRWLGAGARDLPAFAGYVEWWVGRRK